MLFDFDLLSYSSAIRSHWSSSSNAKFIAFWCEIQGPGKCKEKQKHRCDEKFSLNQEITQYDHEAAYSAIALISAESMESEEGGALWEVTLIGATLKNWFNKVQRES